MQLLLDNERAFFDAPQALPDAERGQQLALGGRQAEGLGGVFIHVLNGDADPAAADLFVLLELVDDTFGHAARDGEADTLTAGDDGRVDADNLAFHVDQGAAAVAGVDGGVRLEEVVKRPGLDVAALGAQDARGNRVPQAEGIAMDDDGTLYMVSEPNLFYVFKKP